VATVVYTFVDRCAGGGHTRLDVSINGGTAQRLVYTTDEIREPLGNLTADQQNTLKLLILKVHMAGKTRAQIVTEFQAGPVTVTI
jgi:hypothetical protein